MDNPKSLYLTPRNAPVGQEGLNQMAERARIGRELDKNRVPRSLQGQISPERLEQMQDESIKLPPYSVPRLDLPASASATKPAMQGTAPTVQPMPSPVEADKAWTQEPKKSRLENPLKYKGIEAVPSLNPQGGELEIRVPWEKIFKNK
jgi:hypothetical protein